MRIYTFVLIICTIMIGCTVKRNLPSSIQEIWNQKTFNSIREQLSKANDKYLKTTFRNHFKSAKLLLNDSSAEGQTLRTQFLETIFSRDTTLKRFFVLEFIERGEQYQIKNILIVNTENSSRIIPYQFYEGRWNMVGDTSIKKIDLHDEMTKPPQKNKIGRGLKHVILSEFYDGNISSRFYDNSGINEKNAFFGLLFEDHYFPYPPK